MYEPGSASVRPLPTVIEHAEPGGVSWTMRKLLVGRGVHVDGEPGLLRVEGLRAIDVGDRDDDELQLQVHLVPFVGGAVRYRTTR